MRAPELEIVLEYDAVLNQDYTSIKTVSYSVPHSRIGAPAMTAGS